jgi:hypothetical protein
MISLLHEYITAKKISVYDFYDLTGISVNKLHAIMHNKALPTVDEALKIEKYTNGVVRTSEFFKETLLKNRGNVDPYKRKFVSGQIMSDPDDEWVINPDFAELEDE